MVERTIERVPGVVPAGEAMEPPYWQLMDPTDHVHYSEVRPELRTFYLVEFVAGPDGRGVVMSGVTRSIEPAAHWVLAQVLGVPFRADCSQIIAEKEGAKVRDSVLLRAVGKVHVCPGCHDAASRALARVRQSESLAAGHGVASGVAVSAGADGGAPAVDRDPPSWNRANSLCPTCVNLPCVCDLGGS